MNYYATLGAGNVVVGISDLAGPVDSAQMIWIDSYDTSLLGKVYDGETGEFNDGPVVPPGVPPVVSMRQARLALLAAGKLAAIEQAIDAIEDETQRAAARIEWDFAAMVERGSAFVALLGGAVGLTDEDTDDLFRAAIQL